MLAKSAFIFDWKYDNTNAMKAMFSVLFYYFILYFSVIYSCDRKAEIFASLLQLSGSHDPSEIILIY